MASRTHIAKVLNRLEEQVAEIEQGRQAREEERDRVSAEQQRWKETLKRFAEMIPDDLLDRVVAVLEDEGCRLWDWIRDVFRGRSRLPECLTEDVLRRLVLIRLDEADKCNSSEAVCLHCGLQYPMHKYPPLSEWKLAPGCSPDERPLRYDLPHFFEHDGCPACGASSKAGDANWAHLIEDGYWFER